MTVNSAFKASLLERDLGVDDLLQMYLVYLDFEDLFAWNNPFWEELKAVREILSEKFPDYWVQVKD